MNMEVQDKVARRIKKAKISLMRSPIFDMFGGIMMVGETQVVDNIPTACTDGWNEWYGREFIASLTDDKQVNTVVLHENQHKVMRQLTTWQKLFKEDP